VEGETISYVIKPTADCHVAVFCHQSDGETVVLFPNSYSQDTLVKAGHTVAIPGIAKAGFEIVIGPPFGSDRVQVIACTRQSLLHSLALTEARKSAAKGQQFAVATRGQALRGLIDAPLANASDSDPTRPIEWAETTLVVRSKAR
jgi:hypothetical protein